MKRWIAIESNTGKVWGDSSDDWAKGMIFPDAFDFVLALDRDRAGEDYVKNTGYATQSCRLYDRQEGYDVYSLPHLFELPEDEDEDDDDELMALAAIEHGRFEGAIIKDTGED
jgi:hypothetical protein